MGKYILFARRKSELAMHVKAFPEQKQLLRESALHFQHLGIQRPLQPWFHRNRLHPQPAGEPGSTVHVRLVLQVRKMQDSGDDEMLLQGLREPLRPRNWGAELESLQRDSVRPLSRCCEGDDA